MSALQSLYTEEHPFKTLVVDQPWTGWSRWCGKGLHHAITWLCIEPCPTAKGYVEAQTFWRQFFPTVSPPCAMRAA